MKQHWTKPLNTFVKEPERPVFDGSLPIAHHYRQRLVLSQSRAFNPCDCGVPYIVWASVNPAGT